jgi:uncharacterized protein
MPTRRQLLSAAPALALPVAAQDRPATPDANPFLKAATTGDLEAVKKFLDGDAALRYARDGNGVSVYTLACLAGQTAVAEEFVRRGLTLDIFEAAAGGNGARVTELANQAPGIARLRSADGRTPLHFAAAAGKPSIVIMLSTRGADLSAGPESPLLAAADYPDPVAALEMGSFLLGNASDPNARRKDGKSASDLAAARGYDDLVRLIEHRRSEVYFGHRYMHDVNGKLVTRDDTNGLPWELITQFVSVAHNNFEMVKALLAKCPALLMTRAPWDELAIEAAAHMGLVPMARYLADLGSPISTCTAAMLGMTGRVKETIAADRGCLRERGAHDLPLLAYTAFGTEQPEIAQFLLDAGLPIEVRAFGQTTLHIAAAKGHIGLAQLLIDRGADVNAAAKSRAGVLTPLAVALRAKQEKMADFLRSRGGRA